MAGLLRRKVLTLALLGCSALPWARAVEAPQHALWQQLLQQYVQVTPGTLGGNVRYTGMQTRRLELERYLAQLANVRRETFDAWPNAQQLAFLINAYNAYTVQLVLTGYPGLASIKDLGSLFQSSWKKRFAPLLGATRTLDEIEHEMIRGSGRYNDPRIHFALNCASLGCPALRNEAYVAERLDAQLEDAATAFLADRQRNRWESGRIQVSSIFKWYRSDFEAGWRGARTLRQFLALHATALRLSPEQTAQLRAGTLPIAFLDYDWRLNDASVTSGAARP